MAETKLISHRIDAETLADIDKAVERNRYWKRSSFIDAALELLGWLCSQNREKEIMELMNAKIGDALDAVIDNGKLTLQPAKKQFTHKTLEERMDETGLQLSFGPEIEWGESRGSELW